MSSGLRFPNRPPVRDDSSVSLNELGDSFQQATVSQSTPFQKPFMIAVSGGGSSGKSQVCAMILKRLMDWNQESRVKVIVIRMEDFYRPLSQANLQLVSEGSYNFDHPDAFDFSFMETSLSNIAKGNRVYIPKYDFQKHKRLEHGMTVEKPDVVIVHGILTLYKKRIRDLFDLKVFVDLDGDVRLANQVIRDTESRYRHSLDQVLTSYLKFVKPSFEDYILPSKKFADVIIPRGDANTVAVDLLTEHIIDLLSNPDRSQSQTISESLVKSGLISDTYYSKEDVE